MVVSPAFYVWLHRLGVRTPDFHSGSRGSNPRGATKQEQGKQK